MASRYKFSEEQIKEIEQARKDNKDKRAEARLKALELRAKGASSNEVAAATGFHAGSVTRLVAKYRDHGIEAISGNHYGGNHRNMSIEEEMCIRDRASSLDDHVMVLSVVSSGINSAVSVIVLFLQKGFVLSQSEHNFRLFARTGCTVN